MHELLQFQSDATKPQSSRSTDTHYLASHHTTQAVIIQRHPKPSLCLRNKPGMQPTLICSPLHVSFGPGCWGSFSNASSPPYYQAHRQSARLGPCIGFFGRYSVYFNPFANRDAGNARPSFVKTKFKSCRKTPVHFQHLRLALLSQLRKGGNSGFLPVSHGLFASDP